MTKTSSQAPAVVSLPVHQLGSVTSAPSITPLDDARALAIWLETCKRSKSPHTVRSYEKESVRFRMWLEWHNGADHPKLLSLARAQHVMAFLEYVELPIPLPELVLARYRRKRQPFNGPLATASIRQAVVILSTMYDKFRELQDADDNPYCKFNPFALFKGDVIKAQPLDTDDLLEDSEKVMPLKVWSLVEQYLDSQIIALPRNAAAHRDRWVMKFLYHTWFRRFEAADSKMGYFKKNNAGQWRLSVVGKGRKKKDIVATRKLMEALADYRLFYGLLPTPSRTENRPTIIPLRGNRNVTGQTVYSIVKDIMANVAKKLEHTEPELAAVIRNVSPHWMRHSGLSHSADAGLSIELASKQARHGDIRTTAQSYHHPDDAHIREQLEKAG